MFKVVKIKYSRLAYEKSYLPLENQHHNFLCNSNLELFSEDAQVLLFNSINIQYRDKWKKKKGRVVKQSFTKMIKNRIERKM